MSHTYYAVTIFTREEGVPFGLDAHFNYSSYELAKKSADCFAEKFNVSPIIDKIVVDYSEISETSKPLEDSHV